MEYEELEAMSGQERLAKYLDIQPLAEDMRTRLGEVAGALNGHDDDIETFTIGPETSSYDCEWEDCHRGEWEKQYSSTEFPTAWLALDYDERGKVIEAYKAAEKAKEAAEKAETQRAEQARNKVRAARKEIAREAGEKAEYTRLKQKYERGV